MIAFHDVVYVAADGTTILRDVTLRVHGPRVAVIGANGSGKTTLARMINGLTTPTAGRVLVDGRDVAEQRRDVQRRVGFVFNNPDHQLVYPTPVEDVALGLRARGVGADDAMRAALGALAAVGLAERADQAIHSLSAGEKHLAALAAVLVLEPEWIVMDEPTTALDIPNRRRVVRVLRELPQRQVVISHDLDFVADFDEAVLVHEGTVVSVGPPPAALERYLELVGAS